MCNASPTNTGDRIPRYLCPSPMCMLAPFLTNIGGGGGGCFGQSWEYCTILDRRGPHIPENNN